MLNLVMNTIGAVCALMLAWCMVRACLRKAQKNSHTDSIAVEDYLHKITRITGFSVYETFHKSAEEWRVSADRIERDFKRYLSSQRVPFYVKDFVRKSQKHIDELYRGKGGNLADKKLLLFFTFLTLLFWGGAVFLSLYVIPHILPDSLRAVLVIGPP